MSWLWGVDSIENHTFLPHTLSQESTVIDLGANVGTFSYEITRRYGVRCHGVEANPSLWQKLRSGDRLIFHHFAVNGKDEPITLHISEDITSSSVTDRLSIPAVTGSVVVPGKRLPTFLCEQGIGRVDLLKVDIEGAEVAMFATLTDELLGRIDQITIEFHDDHRLMTRGQFEQIHDRLMSIGFDGIRFASNNSNWLFFRRDRVRVGAAWSAYARLFVRNFRGLLRKCGFRNN